MDDESCVKGENIDEMYAIGYSIDNFVGAKNRAHFDCSRGVQNVRNLNQALSTHAIF